MENEAFWVRVIKSIHGRDGGLGSSNTNRTIRDSIWNGIKALDNDFPKLNLNFANSFLRVISEGKEVLFWKDTWLGEHPLCVTFARLFIMETNKDARVADRITKEGPNILLNWNWNNSLAGRTAAECRSLETLLMNFMFADNGGDSWTWTSSSNGIFSTNISRELLDDKLLQAPTTPSETLRNNLLPQKIGIFVWRAQRNRLPVRLELDKKGIDIDSVRCPLCDNALESLEHVISRTRLVTMQFRRRDMGSFFLLVGSHISEHLKSKGFSSRRINVLKQ
ncbi:uncharacterized protein [Rutidosis leptorrhynchoides]|uniref:uncharacterized protein n=1 Tax=Rutidosis leptorrhynchoides TaxID=125765 RepID=UPI003A99C494